MTEITPRFLKELCKERNYYMSRPELNEVIHITNKGVVRIENLNAFTGLKCIYLEGNAIEVIENLESMPELRSVYLAKNAIKAISSGLSHLSYLTNLDLSYNFIRKVTHLSALPALESLLLTGNSLTMKDDVLDLASCPRLATLDLAENRIEDPEALEVIESMPLRYLRLQGNPVVSKTAHYRKRLLANMSATLTFLDDAPAFAKDVRLAQAFLAGGFDAERAERGIIREEEAAARAQQRDNFDKFVAEAKRKAEENPPPPFDPMRFRAVPIGESEDEEDLDLPESCRMPRRRRPENDTESAEPVQVATSSSSTRKDGTVEGRDVGAVEEETGGSMTDLPPLEQPSEATVAPEASAVVPGLSHREEDPSPKEEDLIGPATIRMELTAEEQAVLQQVKEEFFERELAQRQELRDKILARAAAKAEATSRRFAATLGRGEGAADRKGEAQGKGDGEEGHQIGSPTIYARPVIYGTHKYKELWAMAHDVPEGEQEEQEEDRDAATGAEPKGEERNEAGEARVGSDVMAEAEDVNDEEGDDLRGEDSAASLPVVGMIRRGTTPTPQMGALDLDDLD